MTLYVFQEKKSLAVQIGYIPVSEEEINSLDLKGGLDLLLTMPATAEEVEKIHRHFRPFVIIGWMFKPEITAELTKENLETIMKSVAVPSKLTLSKPLVFYYVCPETKLTLCFWDAINSEQPPKKFYAQNLNLSFWSERKARLTSEFSTTLDVNLEYPFIELLQNLPEFSTLKQPKVLIFFDSQSMYSNLVVQHQKALEAIAAYQAKQSQKNGHRQLEPIIA